jgi:hypothetical protein
MTNYNILFEELITVISERVSENIIKNINTPTPGGYYFLKHR